LDIHLGHGEFKGLLTADTFFQGRRIEVQIATDLWDIEPDGAQASGHSLGFEAVGVALAGIGAFVRLGLKGVGSFLGHGFVDEQA